MDFSSIFPPFLLLPHLVATLHSLHSGATLLLLNSFFILPSPLMLALTSFPTPCLLFIYQLATHEVVEICGKILYQVELSRSSLDHMWGFSVEAELIENSERQDELCCYISRVEDRSTAMQNGEHTASGKAIIIAFF